MTLYGMMTKIDDDNLCHDSVKLLSAISLLKSFCDFALFISLPPVSVGQ